jgi:HEAT repeat protein
MESSQKVMGKGTMPEEESEAKKALDLSEETPSIEGVETDEELLLARDLIRSFIKAIKAFRFYPPDNPALKGFRDPLPKNFQFFLDKYHSFVLQISEYALSFKGKVLYENRDVKKSLAFLFYKDGLRELRFMKGLEEWEIRGLIDIIIQSDSINQLEDDFVTLMWEKDFIHIGYLATDEFLEEAPILIPENVEQFRKDLVFKPIDHDVDVDLLEREAEEQGGLDEYLSKLIEELHSFISNRSVYSLTPDDAERLRKEVESETDPTFVFNIVDTVFEIMTLEKESEPYQDAANILNKILDAYLTLGEFKKASDLLKQIYMLLKAEGLTGWQIEIIRKLIVGAGEEQRIERIGRILENDEEGIRLEDVSSYLVLLQRNSIRPLIKLLGERKKSKTRRVICDALSEIGKNAVEMFAPYIDDPRWYLVRNITYILGRIGKEEALPYIQKAFHHEESRVRREAIQALGLIGGPQAIGLLVKGLTDEDVRIRAMSALSLGKVGKKAALVPLLEVVQSKEFPKKEPEEIKAFFDAVGMVGSNESIFVLQQLLERKSWFGRGKADEVRLGAARTLATIGTPEAMALLESGKNSKEESIRQACLQALKSKPAKEASV